MTTVRTSRMLAFALAVLSLALAAPASAQRAKDTLRVAFSMPFDVIDPYHTGTREITMIMGEMAFDTLIYRDPETFEHRPLLATTWKWVDETTIELELRQGVTWHDGVPFTADDVVYTIGYITDPKSKIYHPDWVDWIKNAEKLGSHKVRIHLKAPFGPAMEYLAILIPILPVDFFDDKGKAGGNGRLVGTGPYKIMAFEPQKMARFEKNPNYFDGSPKGQPSIGAVVVRSLPDRATQIAELVSGGLDWIWLVPPDQAEQLARQEGLKVTSGGTMRINWVGFDAGDMTGKNPFRDVRVRRAVAHAIDRDLMVKQLIGPGAQVISSPCYPSQLGCLKPPQIPSYEYDPAKAKRLLAEAGYADGFETTLWAYTEGPRQIVAEAVQGYLRQVGIRAQMNLLPNFKVFYDAVKDGKVAIQLAAYGSYNINDVQIIMPLYFGGGARDTTRDPELRAWIKEASAISDPARRTEIYNRAVKHIADQAYWAPLFFWSINYAHAADLDFTATPDETPRFYRTKWVK